MGKNLENTICKLSNEDLTQVNGGMLPAAVYALGFVFGMTPAGALVVCGAAVAAGVGAAILTTQK